MLTDRIMRERLPTGPAGGGRGPVVALTGASRGIGLAAARALCAAGYTVVAGARDVRPLETAGLGGQLRAVRLDLTDEGSIEQFAAAVGATARGAASAADRCSEGAAGAGRAAAGEGGAGGVVEAAAGGGPGGLAAVINNAGVGALGAAEEFPLERAREVFEINLWGAARLAQLLLPLLRAGAAAERPAYLVNVGSLIAEYPVPFHAYYAASKGALRAYTLALRGELAGTGSPWCCWNRVTSPPVPRRCSRPRPPRPTAAPSSASARRGPPRWPPRRVRRRSRTGCCGCSAGAGRRRSSPAAARRRCCASYAGCCPTGLRST